MVDLNDANGEVYNDGTIASNHQLIHVTMRNFPPADYNPEAYVVRQGQKVISAGPPQDESKWLCMHWAGCVGDRISHGDLRALIESSPQAIQKIDGQKYKATPAHYATAARKPNIFFVSAIAEACPRIAYAKDNNGWLMLHYAAAYSNSVEMLELLLQLNPSATSTGTKVDGGDFPVHLLATRPDLEAGRKVAMM
jgi:hypothetical protein